MFFRLPNIQIHTWGGLGSQLYALALRTEILELYPKRKVEMHLHTGGVTRRLSELDGVIDSSFLISVRDFLEVESSGDPSPGRLNLLRRKFFSRGTIPHILLKTGIVSRFNSDDQNLVIKPWLRQIRGHYSNRRIPIAVLKRIYADLLHKGFLHTDLPTTERKGIHYRLGDLLVIGTKRPTSIDSLKEGIELANSLEPGRDCLVFSDSVDAALKILASQPLGLDFKPGTGNTWQAISNLVQIEIFIGTVSKVTEWVTIFRLIRDPNSFSIVPESLKPLVERQFGPSTEFRNLYFY